MVDAKEVAKHGLTTALLHRLDQKEADFIPYVFEQTLDFSRHMELITPIWIDHFRILQQWPEAESRLSVTYRPFDLTVWGCLFISTAFFIGITSGFNLIQNYLNRNTKNTENKAAKVIYSQLEYVLTIILSQGNSIPYTTKTSFKIASAAWLLPMVVLINAYTGVLTAMMTAPKWEPIVESLEDIAQSGHLKLTIEKASFITSELLDATAGYKKVLGDQLREDSTLLGDPIKIVDNVLHHDCAYPGSESFIRFAMNEDKKSSGLCRMTSSLGQIPYVMNYQGGMPKGSPFRDAMDIYGLRLLASGIFSYYTTPYYRLSSKECLTDTPPDSRPKPWKMIDLSPAFLVLLVGVILSLLAFIGEALVARLSGKKIGSRQISNG